MHNAHRPRLCCFFVCPAVLAFERGIPRGSSTSRFYDLCVFPAVAWSARRLCISNHSFESRQNCLFSLWPWSYKQTTRSGLSNSYPWRFSIHAYKPNPDRNIWHPNPFYLFRWVLTPFALRSKTDQQRAVQHSKVDTALSQVLCM